MSAIETWHFKSYFKVGQDFFSSFQCFTPWFALLVMWVSYVLFIFFFSTGIVVLSIFRYMHFGWCNMATPQCNIITKKNQKKLLFILIPQPLFSFLTNILRIISSRFFRCTYSYYNYTVIFTFILLLLMAAYDMILSMAAKPFSFPPQYPCLFEHYKFTLQLFLQCSGLQHQQQLPGNFVVPGTTGTRPQAAVPITDESCCCRC